MDCGKIGNLILKQRKEKNMTQKEVADLLNISDKTISKWERGLGCPDVSLLIPLSKILEISIYELLGGEEMDKNSKEKADKVIENTIYITTKKMRIQSIVDKIIITVSLLIILGIAIFWGYVKFYYIFSAKPENVDIKDLISFNEYLTNNSCELTLENQDCDGSDGTFKAIGSMEYELGLPMWRVSNGSYARDMNEEKTQIIANVGGAELLTEKHINGYRFDRNYTKKSMIVNSLVFFIFVKDMESIKFNFKDTSYLIEKSKIDKLYSDKYVPLNELLKDDNWNKYVIDKLDNDDYINNFLKY